MRTDTQRLLICRHGHPRKTEHDPELTSLGHRAAHELGGWAAEVLPAAQALLHTPTTRTRQTAEALSLSFPHLGPVDPWPSAPESAPDWEQFTQALFRRGWSQAVLVAHHTTLLYVLRDLLPAGPRLRHPPPTTALLVEGRAGRSGPGEWTLRAHRVGPLG